METQRLVLEPLGLGHAPKVYALSSNEQVARFMRFDTHTSLTQAEELCGEMMEEGNHAFWVKEKQTGKPVGVFALKEDEGEPGVYSLSAFQSPDSWGKGYNSELLLFFCRYARQSLRAKALTAYVVGDNTASRRSLEKQGFQSINTLYFDDTPSGLRIYRLELSGHAGE